MMNRVIPFLLLANVLASTAAAQENVPKPPTLRVMTFNILQSGGNAANVGFPNTDFAGSRIDEIAQVIKHAQADVVGVQEDRSDNQLLHALGDHWFRAGSIYSRFPIVLLAGQPFLTTARITHPQAGDFVLVNCHWFPPRGGYGPDVVQNALRTGQPATPLDIAALAIERCAIPNGPRGYNATLNALRSHLAAETPTFLTGDFNEPSHLDWTDHYAQHGPDRWVKNPTNSPLAIAVAWPGSKALTHIGMIDSFRQVHPDEAKTPGHTWTPPYPPGTPGRRPFEDQCLERIDRIYHSGPRWRAVRAAVVGENAATADIVPPCTWPSDHRAVVVEFHSAP